MLRYPWMYEKHTEILSHPTSPLTENDRLIFDDYAKMLLESDDPFSQMSRTLHEISCACATEFTLDYYGGDDAVYDYMPAAAELIYHCATLRASDDDDLIYDFLVYTFTGAIPLTPERSNYLREFMRNDWPALLLPIEPALPIIDNANIAHLLDDDDAFYEYDLFSIPQR